MQERHRRDTEETPEPSWVVHKRDTGEMQERHRRDTEETQEPS